MINEMADPGQILYYNILISSFTSFEEFPNPREPDHQPPHRHSDSNHVRNAGFGRSAALRNRDTLGASNWMRWEAELAVCFPEPVLLDMV